MNFLDFAALFLRYKRSGLRHRWGYQRARLEHAIDAGSSGEGLLFVTGFLKSGTTWLRLMLNEHPEMRCYGEGHFFNYYKEGVHFLANPGGYQLMTQALAESQWYKESGHVWLSRETIDAIASKTLESSMISFRNADRVSLIGDKSTIQDCALIRRLFPKAYIVAIVRDGRDVAVSFAYHFKRRGNPTKFTSNGKLDPGYVEKVAKAWSIYNDHLRSLSDTKDKKFFLTKYEDLLIQPDEVLQKLLTLLAVDARRAVVNRLAARNRFQLLSHGRKPGEENEQSFFRKGIAGDWINYFEEEQTSLFETWAGNTLRAFGYDRAEG